MTKHLTLGWVNSQDQLHMFPPVKRVVEAILELGEKIILNYR